MIYRDLLNSKQPRIESEFETAEYAHRGVKAFIAGDRWHYVLGEAMIATRPNRVPPYGVQIALHAAIINGLLDGKTPVSQPVFDYLTSKGFTPTNYTKQDRFISQQEKDFSR